jgi:hypothetical protein
LKAAFDANIKRVVLTSSTAAISDFSKKNTTFTENDWTGLFPCFSLFLTRISSKVFLFS